MRSEDNDDDNEEIMVTKTEIIDVHFYPLIIPYFTTDSFIIIISNEKLINQKLIE